MSACSGTAPDNNADIVATAAFNDESKAMEKAATADSGHYLYISDLTLDPRPDRDGGNVAWRTRVITWPTPLAWAEVGFYDTKTMLQQIGKERLVQMQQDHMSFSYSADLDRDGLFEVYRTGWYQRSGEPFGQFLAAYEDGRLRDVWTHDEGVEPLRISWSGGEPIAFTCNCPSNAKLVYRGDKLRIKWIERSLDR